MGLNLGGMIFLQNRGFLGKDKNKLLDIGPQNVYFTTEQQIHEFVMAQGLMVDSETFASEKKRLSYFSTPRPEETTTLFSEITDLTNIEYNSFDVCPALKTELLDLNFDRLPNKHRNYYDVVLNFGTTEHIFNQWNSFEVMHDAVKLGGIIYHQLPASGYLEHGYYCYTPLFFKELAQANAYVIEEMFLTPAGENFVDEMGYDIRGGEEKLLSAHSLQLGRSECRVPCFNIHVIFRKTRNEQFKVGLEIATAHAAPYDNVMGRYGSDAAIGANHSSVEIVPGNPGAETEQRITQLTASNERKIADLVKERETMISNLVAEREATIAKLVSEREDARLSKDSLQQQLNRVLASRSWRYTAFLRGRLRRARE